MINKKDIVENVEVRLYVNIIEKNLNVKNVKEHVYVSIIK